MSDSSVRVDLHARIAQARIKIGLQAATTSGFWPCSWSTPARWVTREDLCAVQGLGLGRDRSHGRYVLSRVPAVTSCYSSRIGFAAREVTHRHRGYGRHGDAVLDPQRSIGTWS